MRKTISAIAAIASAMSLAVIPAAQAGPGRHMHGNFIGHSYGHYGHRGHGYWHNGRWIALGVGAAILGAAAAASDRDCYWHHGRRYCDY